MRTREHLDAVIKAYDVRGVVGEDIDENFVRDTGAAFAAILREEGENTVAVGHDMRPSSPSLARAFAEGVTSQGLNVTLLGLTSTDELYYAAGSLECAGAMFTASHNPAKYNGIKLCRAGAVPVGQETGLEQIKQMLIDGTPEFTGTEGAIAEQEILAGYADFLRKLVPLEESKPLVVAVDAANGMGGHTVPAVFKGLPFEKTEDPPTNQINAGCYVFKRSVIESIPANRVVSVERETFPGLLAEGRLVVGHVDNSYWRDMGRPDDFTRGSSDLVRGIAPSPLIEGKTGESLVDPSAGIAGGVLLLSGTAVGRGSEVGAGSRLEGTVVFDGVRIEPGAIIHNSIIASGAHIGANAVIENCVIGEGAHIGARCELLDGMRVFPGVSIPDAGVRFSSDA